MMPVVVAIDGPSGVGKSTAGRKLARRLGVPYLDTGAMYRAVGLSAKRRGVTLPIADPEGVVAVANAVEVRVTGTAEDARTFLDGEDVSKEIRTPEISKYASAVSAIPGVRRRLAGMQRSLALEGGGVLEGRDIGTKVVPETPFKFFLTASPEVRARRRHLELDEKGTPQPFSEVLSELNARDEADSTRQDSPLSFDETYVVVDTSKADAEGVVDLILARMREKGLVVPSI
ncbi:MAG TPA: (d)CMP kinase [Thermoanaerobaculia bacterium]|jgi:cytidylate kinase|nr:(d)CMP kinase [Thermoanaerobaculia bacterium]